MYAEILKILGGAAILVAVVGWLTRSLILHLLSKDVEKFKQQLSAANALELEKLRSDLAKQTIEHEIKFRRIDEKIANHLAEIYQRQLAVYEGVSNYVKFIEMGDEPSKDEKLENVSEANKKFNDYFYANCVYVPPKLYTKLKGLADSLTGIANDFTRGRRREERGRNPINENDDDDGDYWTKAFNKIEQKAKPMFTEMIEEIQRRLGVTD